MSNRQIHELDAAPALLPADQIVVSTAAGQLTRRAGLAMLPYKAPLAASVTRTVTARLGESVSVCDFGAVGDGTTDDTAAFVAALATGAREVRLPAGTYRLTAPVAVPARVSLRGAGRDATFLTIDHAGHGLVWGGVEYVDGHVEGLCLTLPASGTGSALRVQGNHFVAYNLRVRGGSAAAWGIELDRCNDFHLANVLMWGDGADAFLANGVWIRNGSSAAINYGDGSLTQLSVRLGRNDTKGLYLEGANSAPGIINNILIAKSNIIAPGRTGCTGVHLKNARRITLVSVDLESLTTGLREEGTAAGMSEVNSYVAVYFLANDTPAAVAYADNNGTIAGAVRGRTFLACDNFPALAGFGDGDAMIQRALWFPSASSGLPAVRAVEQGNNWRIDRGGAAYIQFGPPPTGNNSRITCGVDGLTPPYDATLYMGDPNIRRVTLDAPLHMFERSSAPPMPADQMTVFADGATWNPGFERGLYTRHGGAWHRLLDTRSKGWVAVNEQTGTSYTLNADDLGDVVEMSGAAAKTVTVPQFAAVPGASAGKAPGASNVVTNRKVHLQTTVTQIGTGPVTLSAATGVTLSGPTSTAGDGQSLVLRWTAPGAVRVRLVA